MIFERAYDNRYRRVLAWLPVWLTGPDERDRMKRLNTRARVVWLRHVWVYRGRFGAYIALPDEYSNNNLLLLSMEEAGYGTV